MAVRYGDWKLHIETYSQLGLQYFHEEVPLLFNLTEDLSEKYNLARKYPEVVRELRNKIEEQKRAIAKEPSFWVE